MLRVVSTLAGRLDQAVAAFGVLLLLVAHVKNVEHLGHTKGGADLLSGLRAVAAVSAMARAARLARVLLLQTS